MKSEKAKKTLENSAKYVKKYRSIQGCQPIDEFVLLKNAERAVELAEQEAEERVREKAIEAHRKICFFRNLKDNTCANTATECGEHSCYYMNNFIQKLSENEND